MTLFELFGLLRKHLVLLIVLPIITGVIATGYAMLMPNVYTASTTMYVLQKNGIDPQQQQQQQQDINTQDLSLSSMISNDVATIMTSSRVRKDVAEKLGVASIGGYSLAVSNESSSRVITLSVTGRDPQMAADVANAVVEDVNKVAAEIMNIESVNVIDPATAPIGPSGPARKRYIAVGALAGLLAAVAIIVLMDLLDTRVRDGSEAEEIVGVPVVGHFPLIEE